MKIQEDIMSRLRWALCLALTFTASVVFGQPATVMIIRHAEKPDEGHCLSVRGWQRAAALVPFFVGELSDECGDPEPGFGKPAAIYAQKSDAEHKSRRPFETVQALAVALKLDIKGFAHDDFKAMIREIQGMPAYAGKLVLICWEHHAIPDLAEALGVDDPPDWPGHSFDRVWVIKRRDGKAKLHDVPQKLLYGDTDD
jgi:hypothetical protein